MLRHLARQFRGMNRAEKGTCLSGVIAALFGVWVLAAGGSWLARLAGILLITQQVNVTAQVVLAKNWRRLYESVRDRPRKENWREN
jgi:hypothetical protein